MDLSIIIVNHNTQKLTKQAVRSVLDGTERISYELIIVDNSSDERETYPPDPEVRLLAPVENKGFGHACNMGSRQAQGDYLLYLNSDTIVQPGALEKSVRYCREHPDVGALGIKTMLEDGTLDHGCKRGFPTPASAFYYFFGFDKRHPESKKYGAYRQTFVDENQTSEVDAVSGSFLMTPRAVWEQIGGFDESFFMYGEDLDLCYRIKQRGWRVVYFAEAQMIHLKGQSGLHTKSRQVIYHFYHAMILFYRKHYRKKYNIAVTGLVYLGVWAKYLLTLLKSVISR